MGRGKSQKNNQTVLRGSEALKRTELLSYSDITLKSAEILQDEPFAGKRVELITLSGSYSYGTARPDSDLDLRGIYVADNQELLGIFPPKEHLEKHIGEDDVIVYELGRFFELALRSNPNIIEMLFSKAIDKGDIGQQIKDSANYFITNDIRKTYTGYVVSQIKKTRNFASVEKYGEGDKHVTKSLFHAYRLLENCEDLLTTGQMDPRISNPEDLKDKVFGNKSSVIIDDLEKKLERIDLIPTDLPSSPDLKAVNNLLLSLRHQ